MGVEHKRVVKKENGYEQILYLVPAGEYFNLTANHKGILARNTKYRKKIFELKTDLKELKTELRNEHQKKAKIKRAMDSAIIEIEALINKVIPL